MISSTIVLMGMILGYRYYLDKKQDESVHQGQEEPASGKEHSKKAPTAEELLKQAEDQANVEEVCMKVGGI
jgi:Tfp pilus assembly protein PilO